LIAKSRRADEGETQKKKKKRKEKKKEPKAGSRAVESDSFSDRSSYSARYFRRRILYQSIITVFAKECVTTNVIARRFKNDERDTCARARAHIVRVCV